MNNKDFIRELSQRTGFTFEQTQNIVRTIVDYIGETVSEDGPVQLNGFGTFEVKKRAERTMQNPATGQTMLVPPKLVLSFKPSYSIKESLKKGITAS
jgi:nucleoid DNA-binding protein